MELIEEYKRLKDDHLQMRRGRFDVRRVTIDQGNGVEIMYPNLYRGLGLKDENLTKNDTLLVGFNENVVITTGQIKLPVVVEGKKVWVNFIVVRAYSPYIAILARPWLYVMAAVPSTLHLKVKFPTEQGVKEFRGNHNTARQCLIVAFSSKN
ncbi:uncharacterized protein LOC142628797 [Castanea sativa]|uniref:uncharacterized protein LOC142628797 n=1 Tax=Castanea sativa TaxID=21020 RepID=UPI003F653258